MEKSAHEVQIENGPWVTFDIGIIEFFPHDQNLFRTVVSLHVVKIRFEKSEKIGSSSIILCS
jgi:hypothetical protein